MQVRPKGFSLFLFLDKHQVFGVRVYAHHQDESRMNRLVELLHKARVILQREKGGGGDVSQILRATYQLAQISSEIHDEVLDICNKKNSQSSIPGNSTSLREALP